MPGKFTANVVHTQNTSEEGVTTLNSNTELGSHLERTGSNDCLIDAGSVWGLKSLEFDWTKFTALKSLNLQNSLEKS